MKRILLSSLAILTLLLLGLVLTGCSGSGNQDAPSHQHSH